MRYLNLFAGIFCGIVAGINLAHGNYVWTTVLFILSALNFRIHQMRVDR